MKLIKYCKKEHNLLDGCNTIQLGTLDYYRNNFKGEQDLINDRNEGVANFLDGQSNYFVNQTMPNCYIFSATLKHFTEEQAKKEFEEGYDSFYGIEDSKILEV